jgi:hypothetical protein
MLITQNRVQCCNSSKIGIIMISQSFSYIQSPYTFSFSDKMFFQIWFLRFHVNIIPRIPIIHSIIAFISYPLIRTLVSNIWTTSSSYYAHLLGIYHIYQNSALIPGPVHYFWLCKNPTIQHLTLPRYQVTNLFSQFPGHWPSLPGH